MKELFLHGVRIDWDKIPERSYVYNIPSLKDIYQIIFNKNIIFFVGENGVGKSTLLEAMAIDFGFNAEGGTKNYNFSTFNDISPLTDGITLLKGYKHPKFGYFFRAETFYNLATAALEYDNIYHFNSHREGNLKFLLYDKVGLYLMDEPEAALSPRRQLMLLEHIHKMAKKGAQFVIATHSPILLGCPDAQIFSLDNGKIRECKYEDTQCYKITKRFIEEKDKVLEELFLDE